MSEDPNGQIVAIPCTVHALPTEVSDLIAAAYVAAYENGIDQIRVEKVLVPIPSASSLPEVNDPPMRHGAVVFLDEMGVRRKMEIQEIEEVTIKRIACNWELIDEPESSGD